MELSTAVSCLAYHKDQLFSAGTRLCVFLFSLFNPLIFFIQTFKVICMPMV